MYSKLRMTVGFDVGFELYIRMEARSISDDVSDGSQKPTSAPAEII